MSGTYDETLSEGAAIFRDHNLFESDIKPTRVTLQPISD